MCPVHDGASDPVRLGAAVRSVAAGPQSVSVQWCTPCLPLTSDSNGRSPSSPRGTRPKPSVRSCTPRSTPGSSTTWSWSTTPPPTRPPPWRQTTAPASSRSPRRARARRCVPASPRPPTPTSSCSSTPTWWASAPTTSTGSSPLWRGASSTWPAGCSTGAPWPTRSSSRACPSSPVSGRCAGSCSTSSTSRTCRATGSRPPSTAWSPSKGCAAATRCCPGSGTAPRKRSWPTPWSVSSPSWACSPASAGATPASRSPTAPCRPLPSPLPEPGSALPGALARFVVEHADVLALDGPERVVAPLRGTGQRFGQVGVGEPADRPGLERMGLELAAQRPAQEHQAVQRDAREPEAQAVEQGDELHRLATDAGLLVDLLHGDLARRVADVGPARRVEPDAAVGPLHQQDPALVVVHHRPHRHLGGDVAAHPLADALHPLVDEVLGVELLVRLGGRADVAGHGQHLVEPLAFVEALREAQARAALGLGERAVVCRRLSAALSSAALR